ncbi:hypothetical protein SAMN05421780_101582 [Flexibacter flexilis DSM 6793]|uniref:Uncharacterized protein n=1 Tax=Flexibacter flexilis DSM 6793 TaxID=927664 RepID=A0A1I1E236_9BACT|nr:hypothetical protein [Flexibacter flexilis]SFB81117.1 hypothetical protein SAMN05421780_101582 [Flexibacter flexilis DSM 6793]
MWKITEHKEAKSRQDIMVLAMIKEIIEHKTYITYAGSFIDEFKSRLAEIPRANKYSADLMYRTFTNDEWGKTLKIAKLNVLGDVKAIMYTLSFESTSKTPIQ